MLAISCDQRFSTPTGRMRADELAPPRTPACATCPSTTWRTAAHPSPSPDASCAPDDANSSTSTQPGPGPTRSPPPTLAWPPSLRPDPTTQPDDQGPGAPANTARPATPLPTNRADTRQDHQRDQRSPYCWHETSRLRRLHRAAIPELTSRQNWQCPFDTANRLWSPFLRPVEPVRTIGFLALGACHHDRCPMEPGLGLCFTGTAGSGRTRKDGRRSRPRTHNSTSPSTDQGHPKPPTGRN